MKKFIAAIVLASALSAPAFAKDDTENSIRMDEMRRMFYEMTDQMMNDQMNIMKMQMASLTNYQKLLRRMMENEQGGGNNGQ